EGGEAIPYDPQKAFALKPLWARFLIVFAGPGMNFVLAVAIFAVVFATFGRPVWPAVVGRVLDGSPAAAAGIKTGDTVLELNGRRVLYWEDLERALADSGGRAVTVERGGKTLTLTVTPRAVPEKAPATGQESTVGKIDAGIATKSVRFEPYGPVAAVEHGAVRTWDVTVLTFKGLWKLVSRQIDSSNIGGPIQIATEAGSQAKEGLGPRAIFTAFISLNLAVLNLLPVPRLD